VNDHNTNATWSRTFAAWTTFLALVLFACKSENKKVELRPDQSQAIDGLLRTQMSAQQIPGMAVAVIRNGTVVKEVTLGFANVESRLPVTAATPFQLASTTKSFVATSVLLLVRDHRLQLDDRIGGLLDDLPSTWGNVTVRQLLSHTSGIPDIVRTPGQLDLIADSWEKALPLVADAPLQFAPGESWAYTQTNYVLLSQIVQRLSGKSIEVFMAERLFHPLGMNATFYAGQATETRSCATNYSRVSGSPVAVRRLDFPPFVHAAGGLCSSLGDLVRWNRALDEGRVLPPELTRELWTTTRLKDGSPARIGGSTLGYGLGWVVDETPGHKSVGHSGGNSTAYRRYIDDGFTIIVLHNGVLDPDGLISSIASIVQRGPGDSEGSAQEQLWDASRNGDTKTIERALAAGADIEGLDLRTNKNGRRALNWAAVNDRADAIRLLLAKGAAIDAANKTGFTALHHAAEFGSRKAAEVLLAAGANRSIRNSNGESPAEVARRNGHTDLAAAIESRESPAPR
jgi:CubicO group peptidase (beta-lactamase class C family)